MASEATEREIDIDVRDIVVKAFDRATEVLQKRRADLDEGARLLLAQETVTADQFPATLGGSANKVRGVTLLTRSSGSVRVERAIEPARSEHKPSHRRLTLSVGDSPA
jgi:hypothetical protein